MKTFRMLGVVCLAVLLASLKPAAQTVSIQAELLKDWAGLKETMDKIANAMPEDKFSYKPTPAQRDYAQQIMHIAQANVQFLGLLGGKAVAPAIDAKATGKAATIKAMDDSFDYGTAILKEQNDQTISLSVAMPPAFLGPSSRARMFTVLIGHTWDIYGQMVVYLRLNNVVPPASVRP